MLSDRRRLVTLGLVFVLGIVAIYFLFPKVAGLDEELDRIDNATWYWVVVAIAFNLAAFAAYMALFRGILGGHRESEIKRRLGPAASYQITMAGLAATRLFSAAGAGGLMLTYWALRKAGMERRRSACRMVAFLVLTYSIYLIALVLFGVLLRTGVLPGDNPVGGTIVPAGIAGATILILGLVALIPDDIERRLEAVEGDGRAKRLAERLATVPATLASGVRTALDYLAPPQPRRAGGGGRGGLLGGEHRRALGQLRGVRRRRAVRGPGAGLLRGDGREPDPVARGRRRIGGCWDDRGVRAVRHSERDRVPRSAHLPGDRLLAADPARHRRLLPAAQDRGALGARATGLYFRK